MDLVRFKTKDSNARGVILYFHGNKVNIGRYAPFATVFTKNGFECWMIDYPGYGKSTGKLTQETMQLFALRFYDLALKKFAAGQIVIYGKSLGTGPASYLASKNACSKLILETPYSSMHSLAFRYFPVIPVQQFIKMDFTPVQYFKSVKSSIVILHGLQDEVIPFSEALKLVPAMKSNDLFIPIPGGRHNTLPATYIYMNTIDSLLKN